MNIERNGKLIYLDDNEDLGDALKLKCICGHTLGGHSFTHAYGTDRTWITSQCVSCGFHEVDEDHPQGFVCEQFRIGPGKNDARWSGY